MIFPLISLFFLITLPFPFFTYFPNFYLIFLFNYLRLGKIKAPSLYLLGL